MHIHKVACLFGEICLALLGQCTPYGAQHAQHDKAACRHACHGQHRAADNHTEHGACGQPFTDAAQQHQQQSIAHRDAQALGDSLAHRLLHAAKAVGQQRLHREHGQVDAKAQQAGAEQHIQDGIHRQIHHRRAEAVHQCTGQQLFLQLFRGSRSRSEVVATFLAVLELCKASVIRLAGSQQDCTVKQLRDLPDDIKF